MCILASGASLKGTAEMKEKFFRFAKRYPDFVGAGLYQETEIETTECKKRAPVYVGPPGPGKPIPGVLRGSIHTEGPFREGTRIWTKVVAGGAASAYAVPQHERTDYFHKVGQAKYIESVILESRPFMATRVARRIHFTNDLIA